MLRKTYIEDGKGKTYMIRWNIFPWLKLHKFLSSDHDCMHDHPWNFLSIMLKGSYIEETPAGSKLIKAPSILYRKATHKHRILYTGKPCWTLVFNGKFIREWGFYVNNIFVHWKSYIIGNRNHCN